MDDEQSIEYPLLEEDKEFYLHYGHAMVSWQLAERCLIEIFADAIGTPSGFRIASIIYYANNSFQTRMRIITDCLLFYLGEDNHLFRRWVDLNQDLSKYWKIRGIIAHPHLHVPVDPNDPRRTGPASIGNKPYSTNPKPPNKRIGIDGLKEHGHEVWNLGLQLYGFRGELLKLLPSLQKSSQQQPSPSVQRPTPQFQIDEIPQAVLALLEPYRLKE